MATSKNFIVKNGLIVGGQEVISSSGVVTSAALGGQTLSSTDSPTFANLTVSNDLAVSGDLNLTGDLNITGNVNTLSVTDLDVTDQTITLGVGQVASASGGSGIVVERTDSTNPSILWDETNTEFDINNSINVTGSVTADDLHIDSTSGQLKISRVGSSDTGIYWDRLGTQDAAIQVAANEHLNIDNNFGNPINLRIGADASETTYLSVSTSGIDVTGDLTLQDTTPIIELQDTSGIANGSAFGVIRFKSSNNNLNSKIQAIQKNGTSSADLLFFTRTQGDGTNTDGGEERLRITSTGLVGIGTNDPASTLHVDAAGGGIIRVTRLGTSASAYGRLEHDGTNTSLTSSAALIFNSNATEAMRIDSSGNIQIKTTTNAPTNSVSLPGYIEFRGQGWDSNSGSDDMNAKIEMAATYGKVGLGATSPELVFSLQGAGGLDSSSESYVEAMRIVGAGAYNSNRPRVGIGTALPSSILQIGDGTTSEYITIDKSATGESGILFKNASNNKGKIILDSNENLQFYVNDTTNAMTILESGNVGIGKTPGEALDVYDVGESWIRVDSSHTTESTANSGLRFAHGGVNHGVLYHQGSSDSLLYFDNIAGSTRFLIDSSGKFGIGQSSPSQKLHIGNGESNFIRIHNAASGDVSSGIQITRGNADGVSIYDNPFDDTSTFNATGNVNFRTDNGSYRIYIKKNGAVAVGGNATAGKSFEVQDRQSGYSSFWVDDNNRLYGRGTTNAMGLLGGNSTSYDGDGAYFPMYGFGGAADNAATENIDFWIKSTTYEWQPMTFFCIGAASTGTLSINGAGWALIRATHYNNGISSSILDSGGSGTFSISVVSGSLDGNDVMQVRIGYSQSGANRCTVSAWCNTYQHIRGAQRA